jgi:hypothetical protein
MGRRRAVTALVLAGLLVVATGGAAAASERVVGPMPWLTQFMPTWNPGAPKVVSDGLHFYAAVCCVDTPTSWSIVRKRGSEAWSQASPTFFSSQPPVVVIDRKGRLHIFSNGPQLRHLRYDHPAIDLTQGIELAVPFNAPVAYLHASYDASSDMMMLAFSEPSTWTTHVGVARAEANDWLFTALPDADPTTFYLYARTLRAGGRYFVLVAEHPRSGPNHHYLGARLFESASPAGPWTSRALYRVTGNNAGVPYQNWVLISDLQADASGRPRALLHITEGGSGLPSPKDGLYIAREEDAYALRFVGGPVADGYTLYVDPSGYHVAFGQIESVVPFPEFEGAPLGVRSDMVTFESRDGGASWSGPSWVELASINPVPVDQRSGSMLGGKEVPFIYSTERHAAIDRLVFDEVRSSTVALAIADTDARYDYWYTDGDGTQDYLRAFTDAASNRSYYYIYNFAADGSFTVSYSYTASDYYQVYIGSSNGSYRYYNSDGYQFTHSAPEITQYWYTDTKDGTQDWIYIYKDESAGLLWWAIYDFDLLGNWNLTYVYYLGDYWYIELRSSLGPYQRWDSRGLMETYP